MNKIILKHAINVVIYFLIGMNVLLSALPSGWKTLDSNWDHTCNYFARIRCIDSLNCIFWDDLSCGGGYIFRGTTDGGNSWKSLFMDRRFTDKNGKSHYVPEVREIAYPNEKLFIAVGDSGLVVRTTDKGETWQKFSIGKNVRLSKLRMLDENYGIVFRCGYYPADTCNMLETIDGGLTWNKMNKPVIGGYYDIKIINRNLFYAIIQDFSPPSAYHLLKVYNSWEKWDTITAPLLVGYMDFINENEGWVAGGYQRFDSCEITTQFIYYTSDAGNTWVKQRDTAVNCRVAEGIDFFDKNFGIVKSCNSMVLITTDGGNTWQEQIIEKIDSMSGRFYCINDAVVASPTTAYIIFEGDSIIKYTREPTGVNDKPKEQDGISVSPNPVTDILHIKLSSSLPLSMVLETTVYNILGETVMIKEINREIIDIDVSGFTPGLYFYSTGNLHGRFVKM